MTGQHNPGLWRSMTNDAQIIRCCGEDFGNATRRLKRGESPGSWSAFIAHIEQQALASSEAKMAAALQDFADHGLRADLNPTTDGSSVEAAITHLCGYLRRLDESVRARARNALAGGS